MSVSSAPAEPLENGREPDRMPSGEEASRRTTRGQTPSVAKRDSRPSQDSLVAQDSAGGFSSVPVPINPKSQRAAHRYYSSVTRLGYHTAFVTVFAMGGGAARGFNLLLLLAALLVGVALVHWRLGRRQLRRLSMELEALPNAHAGQPFSLRYRIANLGRWLPLWMIRLDQMVRPLVTSTVAALESDQDHRRLSLTTGAGYVPSRSALPVDVQCCVSYRGVYQPGFLLGSSTFPFGLVNFFQEQQSVGNSEDVTPDQLLFVYPALLPQTNHLQRWLGTLEGEHRASTTANSQQGEFMGLRPWQHGDLLKNVHWRTSARMRQPAVRQFQRQDRRQVWLVVDGAMATQHYRNAFMYERTLQLAITLIQHWQSSQGAGDAVEVSLSVIDHWTKHRREAINDTDDEAQTVGKLLGAQDDFADCASDVEPALRRLAVSHPLILEDDSSPSAYGCLFDGIAKQFDDQRRPQVVVISSRPNPVVAVRSGDQAGGSKSGESREGLPTETESKQWRGLARKLDITWIDLVNDPQWRWTRKRSFHQSQQDSAESRRPDRKEATG